LIRIKVWLSFALLGISRFPLLGRAVKTVAREMAAYISPRPGFTQHPLTIHAAAQMNDCVDRAERFRKRSQS
jgi:hypothetical protein